MLLRPMLPPVELDVEVRDRDDLVVVVAALAARAEAIVSGDRGLLDDPALRSWLRAQGIIVLTVEQAAERSSG